MPDSPSPLPLLPPGPDAAPRLHPATAAALPSASRVDGHGPCDGLAGGPGASSSSPSSTSLVASSAASPAPASARPDKAQQLARRRKRELASLAFSNPGRGFAVEDLTTDDHSSSDTTRRSFRRRSAARQQTQPTPPTAAAAAAAATRDPSAAPSVADTTASSSSLTHPPPSARPSKRPRTGAPERRKSRTSEHTTTVASPAPHALDKGKGRAKEDLDPSAGPSETPPVPKTKGRRKSTPAATSSSAPPRRRSGPTRRASGPCSTAPVSSSLSPCPDETPAVNRKRTLSHATTDQVPPPHSHVARPSSFIPPGTPEADALISWYRARRSIAPTTEWRPTNPAHLPKKHAALMEARAAWAQSAVAGRADTHSLSIPLDQLHGPPPPLPPEPDPDTVQARLTALWERSCYLEDDQPDISPSQAETLAAHQGRVLARIDQLREQGMLLADYLPDPDALTTGRRDATSSHTTSLLPHATNAPDFATDTSSAPGTTPAPGTGTFATYLKALAPPAQRPQGKSAWGSVVEAIPGRAKGMGVAMEGRIRGTRKVAKMVTQHWERLAARGERERKAEERRVRALARWTSREVLKQWRLAITVVRKRKTDLARAADEQRGREQLSQILQQSTRMLEQRQRGMTHGHITEFEYDPVRARDDADDALGLIEEETDERDVSDLSMTDAETDEADLSDTPDANSTASQAVAGPSLLANLYTDDMPSPASLAAETTETGKSRSESLHIDVHVPSPRASTSTRAVMDVSHHLSPPRDHSHEEAASEEDVDMADENADDESEDDDLLATADVPLDELLKNYPGYIPAAGAGPELGNAGASTDAGDEAFVVDVEGEQAAASRVSPLTPIPSAEAQAQASREEEQDAAADRAMMEELLDETDDTDEDAGLLADADLPIEDLLRRFRRPSDDEVTRPIPYPDPPYPAAKISKPSLTSGLLGPDSPQEIKLWPETESNAAEEDIEVEELISGKNGFAVPTKPLVEELSDNGQVEQKDDQNESPPTTRSTSPAPGREVTEEHDAPEPRIRPPFLLRGTLRPYQQTGLEWLADLYSNNMNGILADEMGLGKTIQTIALLAHLACDRGIWGPHLVVAPTSVMLNWEMEFKKFLPGFKILSYYGNQRERKEKRVGWHKENSFNVCITSYQLVLADQHIFRRKAWMYLILDEAHHIKNFRAKRWQTLLGFNSQRRLLLTGTPLQNNLMDLWSLMYFLMPHGIDEATGGGAFASIKDFQDWFANPLDKAIQSGDGMDAQTRDMVSKLHTVLRPFILRRLKSEVERELPQKYEHVITCRLSKRQRFLYNDFMSRAATRQSLASGNYLSIINCLMQLRKVCNHPDLFEVRPIITAFAMERAVPADYEIKELLVRRTLLAEQDARTAAERAQAFDLGFTHPRDQVVVEALSQLDPSSAQVASPAPVPPAVAPDTSSIAAYRQSLGAYNDAMRAQRWARHHALNAARCRATAPSYSSEVIRTVRSLGDGSRWVPLSVAAKERGSYLDRCDAALEAIQPYEERMRHGSDLIDRFAFVAPAVYAPRMAELALPGVDPLAYPELRERERDVFHEAAAKLQVSFPDASLLQYDCGKLQQLDRLMRRLKDGGHRILIFTQMTKVLDILESFLSFHGHRYLRLDGATKVEDRPLLTERFNRDPRIMAFILSTRSGGLGINLTGADTVLFYDLDWNAAIEQQCMDRAHRIGQTRNVHIYRFVSEHTIEENMLKKANQKRVLDNVVIQQGEFSTDSILRSDWRDMLDDGGRTLAGVQIGDEAVGSGRDVERAMLAAEDEEDRAAAQAAREEMMVDLSDWGAEAVPARERGAPPGAAGGAPVVNDEEGVDDAPEAEAEAEDEEEEDEEEGTVDDYMLHWVEADWPFFSNL